MEHRVWLRAVLAGTATTAAFVAWRWAFAPVFGEGTLVPWTVLAVIAIVATVLADRSTRPCVGIATTASAAGLADLISGPWSGSGGERAFDLLYVAFAAGVLAAPVSGLHTVLKLLPRARRPRAWAVVALGGSAWVAWLGWWPLDDSGPAHPDVLVVGAVCTLVAATVLGEITLGPWRGALCALPSATLVATPPLATTDALWIIAWVVLFVGAAATCLTVVGAVALGRATHRRLRPAV